MRDADNIHERRSRHNLVGRDRMHCRGLLIHSVDLDRGVCLMRLRSLAEAESTLLEAAEQTRGPTYRKTH
jgi:hypothetical protein